MIDKKKFKKIIKLILLTLILANLVFLIIFYDGNLKYNLMRFTAESQNFITELKLFRATETRNFPEGLKILNQQLDRTQNLSPGNNKPFKGLFQNIKYSFNSALNIEDRDHYESFLKKIVDLYPDIYSFRIWYAQTLENNNPNELYKQLDEAIKIVGSDSRAYRIGIKNAFKNQDNDKLNMYCNMYKNNQFGGIVFAEQDWIFTGIGLRSMAIELLDNDKKIFIANNGLNLTRTAEYEFLIPSKIFINNSLKLHLASTNGMQLNINRLIFFLEGYKVYEYLDNEISFTTENSFVNNDGSIILLSKDKPEIIEIFINIPNQQIRADKIILDLGFERLSTASLNLCHKSLNQQKNIIKR